MAELKRGYDELTKPAAINLLQHDRQIRVSIQSLSPIQDSVLPTLLFGKMATKRFITPYAEDIVSQLAQDETGKRQYYRPVYSLHKWWARRPGALFRSIILSATKPGNPLFQLTYDGSISNKSEYFKSHDLKDIIILDPFMGGGTTLVEANRLGAKVIGCDLNPVSYWIVRETIKPIDVDKLDQYFYQLSQTAGERIRSLYKTRCEYCNAECDSLYVFWVRYVKCPACNNNTYLYKRTLLNEGSSRNAPISLNNPATTFCPRCFALNEWGGDDECACGHCGEKYQPREGTYNQGYYTCSSCGESRQSLTKTLRQGEMLREKLIAIEYWSECYGGRLYKSPDIADLENIAQINKKFEESIARLVFPRQSILVGASSHRWRVHNYQYYYEIFNARQLMAFNHLIEGINSIPEEEYRNAFITVFSNSLEYNNLMTPYNYPHRKLHHLFNYHAMPLTTTPVENVVWGIGSEGAGTFINCYQRYLRAKQYCQRPYDKFKDSRNSVETVFANDEKISANFVSTFGQLTQTERGALLLCGDSSHLSPIPDQSVDFVITDPPYLDSIHYSELSNFFYIWLKCLTDHPYFNSEHVPTEQEAIVNEEMDKGEDEYQELLKAVFKESERVLKHEGKLIFTFHHTKWRAWWIMLRAVVESGFQVIDSFPVMSEYKVNPHIRNKQALDMDLVLICQKRSSPPETLSSLPIDILERVTDSLSASKLNHNSNKLFLHFMGEVLRTASSIYDSERIDYNWFANILAHFDDLLLSESKHVRKYLQQEITRPRQLRLLEGNTIEDDNRT